MTVPETRTALLVGATGLVGRACLARLLAAPLYAKVAGYVDSVPVDIGDPVEKGQTLIKLHIPELQNAVERAFILSNDEIKPENLPPI